MHSAREFLESGINHLNNDQVDDAINDLNKSIELDESCAEAYRVRGKAYSMRFVMANNHNLVDHDHAMSDLEKSISLDPLCFKTYMLRSALYQATEQFLQAIADINLAIELEPHTASLHLRKAILLQSTGNPEEAIAALDEAIKLKPNSIKARHARALFYLGLPNLDKAHEDIIKIKEINPEHELAYVVIYAYYQIKALSLGVNHAIPFYNEAIEAASEQNELYHLYLGRGCIYQSNHQANLAVEDFSKAITLNPKGRDAYFNRAMVYHSQNEDGHAIKDLEESIKLLGTKFLKSPGDLIIYLSAHLVRAKIHDAQNNIYQAACDYSKVKSRLNVNPFSSYILAGAGYDIEKYDFLVNLINERDLIKNHYSPDQAQQFSLITDQINHLLKALRSNEQPLNHIQTPQPLMKLAGFFVTKNREQFKQLESDLPQDLIDRVNDGSFLAPEEDIHSSDNSDEVRITKKMNR